MILNPLEREDTNTHNQSKHSKSFNNTVVPLSIQQIGKIILKKDGISSLGKVALVGRIVKLKDMLGRTIIHLCDETGVISIIEGQNTSEMQEEEYFKFIVSVRIDKQEGVLYSQQSERITNFNQIQNHFANVMMTAFKIPALNI